LSVLADSTKVHAVDNEPLLARVTAFLGAISEVPDDGDLETHLVISDGARTWGPDDLAATSSGHQQGARPGEVTASKR